MRAIRRRALNWLGVGLELIGLVGGGAGAVGGTIEVSARQDATIFENNPDNASGAGTGLFAGTNGTGSPRRGLVAFDLSSVPAGAVVMAARMTLYLGQYAGEGGGGGPNAGTLESTIGMHRIDSSWGEEETQRRSPPSDSFSGTGQGSPALANDVTWVERFFGSTTVPAWEAPGGDFDGQASARLVVGRELDAPHTWPSSARIVSDVQGWLANPATNFGWMLVNEDEESERTFRAFYSRDAATAAYHPTLAIDFVVPEALTADFDFDRDVDGQDFLAWQRGFGMPSGATRGEGDANSDGAVTAADLSFWTQQFGTYLPSLHSVAEPSAARMAAVVLAAAMGGRRMLARRCHLG